MCYTYNIVEKIYLQSAIHHQQKEDVNMPASKAQQKAVSKYMKQNYDEIKVRVDKGHKAEIKAHADSIGESVNSFIGRAINETMARDSQKE